ncbi:MAG TPA: MFS transporter [Gaiellales bacterium]|nr:MFS transporter [Gaiellales bacterium]
MADQGRAGSQRGVVIAAMTLANAMILVDQTAVPLALPNIIRQLHVSAASVQWVMTASLLPLAGLLVLGGRLGDTRGRRRVFIVGAVLFGGASAVGGLAPDFSLLLTARVVQGVGGALMLPATVAIVSASVPPEDQGGALGLMGGVAAVAGALGPTIGGVLTSAFSWRAVLLVNVPLLLLTLYLTLRSVPRDSEASAEAVSVDVPGALFLFLTLVGLVYGLSESQTHSFRGPIVLGPVIAALVAGAVFVVREQRAAQPVMSFDLLRAHRNYLGATLSQFIGGMTEMGLSVIFPLILILNLGMPPAKAGLALIPTTIPMVILAPLVGRWYDRGGGRVPMMTGFASLAAAGVVLAVGVNSNSYPALLPGLLLYGIGLSIVLTVNDPVTLDSVPEADHGQAAGVSATAEQGGGAIGIAALFAVFHYTYVADLHDRINASPLPDLHTAGYEALRSAIIAAENTGLNIHHFPPQFVKYVLIAEKAADRGYVVVFVAVAILSAAGVLVGRLVTQPDPPVRSAPPPRPIPEVEI